MHRTFIRAIDVIVRMLECRKRKQNKSSQYYIANILKQTEYKTNSKLMINIDQKPQEEKQANMVAEGNPKLVHLIGNNMF